MKTILRGQIAKFIPSFQGTVIEGKLVLIEDGNLTLIVDTGFSGGIALPSKILDLLDKEFLGDEMFTLATGDSVALATYRAQVVVRKLKFETLLIPGNLLLGLEFLSSVGNVLSLNLKQQTVRLAK